MPERRRDGLRAAMIIAVSAAALGGCEAAALVADTLPMAPNIGGMTSATTESNFKNSKPLVATAAQVASVKTVAVAPPFEKATPKEVVYLAEQLTKNGTFKVLSPNALSQKVAEAKADLKLMTGAEKIGFLCQAARALGADALMVFSTEEVQTKTEWQIFIGRGSVEGKNRLQLYAANSGQLMWEQIEEAKVTMGAYAGTPNEDALMRDQLDPLIKNFLKTFGPESPEQLGSPDGHQG